MSIIHIKTITEIHNLLQLPKPRHPLVSVIPLDEKILNYDFGDHTFVLDMYQISLKQGVSGSLFYGRNSYDFQEGTVICTRPGQAMKMEVSENESREDYNGWVLLFHPDLIRRSDLAERIEQYSFFSYDINEALHLSEVERKCLSDIVDKIQREYEYTIDRHSQKIIISNIDLLLDYCTRYYDRQFYTRTNLNQDTVSSFEKILKDYYQDERQVELGLPSVSYCASKLNLSPQYLSDLLRQNTGQGAKGHIDDFVLNQAKNKLLGSDDYVSQIGYQLGFEYPQHFNKFFKTKMGLSPSEYRKTQ